MKSSQQAESGCRMRASLTDKLESTFEIDFAGEDFQHTITERRRLGTGRINASNGIIIRFERPEALDELNRPDRIRAQHECWRERRCTMHDLWHFADVCRVRNVMRPYMESLAV